MWRKKQIEKKHIYITALHLNYGGAEMAICNLANGFTERGYQVTIWCIYRLCEPVYKLHPSVRIEYLTKDKPNRQEFLDALHGYHLLTAFREGIRSIGILLRKKKVIVDKIKSVEDGVILSTRLEHNIILARYGNSEVVKIGQSHYGESFGSRLIRQIKRIYIDLDYFVLLTESLRDKAEAVMPPKHHCKCVCIGNYLEDKVREKLSDITDAGREKTVVSVGRLSPEKGFDRLISIWKKISHQYTEWQLYIIGDGNEREKLMKLAGTSRTIFVGNIPHDEVLEYMKKGSVYAMTSYTEGFPYVLLEACNAGMPIVAYDVPTGPAELVKDTESGFLIPDGDAEMFGEKLELLLQDAGLRKKMGAGGKAYAGRFTKQKTLDKWEELLM